MDTFEDIDEAPVPAPAPAGGPVKTVEDWATAKGMLPEFTEGRKNPRFPKAPAPQIHNPKFAPFHASRAANRWPIGMEMTEAEFDQAIADTKAHVYR